MIDPGRVVDVTNAAPTKLSSLTVKGIREAHLLRILDRYHHDLQGDARLFM